MRSRPSSGSTPMPSPLVATESDESSSRSSMQVRRKSSVRSRSPVVHDRSAAAALKASPPGPGSPRTGKPGAVRGATKLNGTSRLPSRSRLPRAARPLSMTSHGKENMALLQSTLPSSSSGVNLLEDVCSPGSDDTVESASFAQASTIMHTRKSCLKKTEQPVEYDDGKSTDITPEMLRECVRKEGDHDDLGRMLAADLSGLNISLINKLDKCRMLRQLDLSYNRITSTRGLDSLYQLRELKLTCNKVPSIFEINKLTALEHLHLQVNRIKEIGKQALRDNKKLRTLRLDGNELNKLQYLDGQVMLQHFDASQNQLTKIEGLGMMGQLEVLALAFNQIPVIEGLGAMGRLRELDLSHNEISVLQGLKQCGQLEILRLDNNNIQNLDGLTKLPNMMEIYLNNNQLTRASDQIVKMCPGLEFLHLSGNNLTELSEVRAMAGLTALIDLRLADNPICKYKAFDEHVKDYLSMVDTLDDEDIRGVRAKVERQDADKEAKPGMFLKDGVQVAEQDAGLTDQVLDRGGVTFGKARDFGAKELAEVLPIEEFEGYLRSIRNGIANVKQDLHDSMYKLMFPPDVDKKEEARKEEQRLKEIAERDARMAARQKELQEARGGKYEKGAAAVEAALQRKHKSSAGTNAPSLREIMVENRKHTWQGKQAASAGTQEESPLDESAQLETEVAAPAHETKEAAAAPAGSMAGGEQEGGGPAASKREIVLPESMRRMNEELEKRLVATSEALQLEIDQDDDEYALSPRHPAPASPIPHPTKEQIAEMRRAVDEEENVVLRARTAASESMKQLENEQHARFVQQLVDGTPEKKSTPPAREEPFWSAHKERPAPDLARGTPSKGGRDDLAHGVLLASVEKLRKSQAMEGLRRSHEVESWEASTKRRRSALETEMFSLDYEATHRVEVDPPRVRPQSSRPHPCTTTAASANSEGADALSIDELRESLSTRASKRLAEAIEFSATQSPASPHLLYEDEEDGEVLYEYDEKGESELVLDDEVTIGT